MRKHLKDSLFECNTNGDFLNEEYAKKLFINGLDILYINLYDGVDQIEKFENIMKNANIDESKYSFRAHYSQKDYGLKLNNRGGNITWLGFEDSDIESLKGKPCNYPFYKLVGNIVKEKLFDVWFSDKMYEIRKKLKNGKRDFSPCNKCSVDGQLFGKKSFDIINEYYDSIDNK
jgi:MoaA/NifB/PqqE/SkfB family radical SAM enzyme